MTGSSQAYIKFTLFDFSAKRKGPEEEKQECRICHEKQQQENNSKQPVINNKPAENLEPKTFNMELGIYYTPSRGIIWLSLEQGQEKSG